MRRQTIKNLNGAVRIEFIKKVRFKQRLERCKGSLAGASVPKKENRQYTILSWKNSRNRTPMSRELSVRATKRTLFLQSEIGNGGQREGEEEWRDGY